MTVRETSREAYKHLVESGQLLGKQAEALKAIIEHGPATSGEIIDAAELGGNINLWRARFSELQERGLIREVSQRTCKVTGRTALVWEYTGRTKALDLKRGTRRGKINELKDIAILAIDALADDDRTHAKDTAAALRKRLLAVRA